MADNTFSTLVLDNASTGENLAWITTTSKMILTCVKGGALVADITDDPAGIDIISMNDGDPTLRHKVLDFYQGAKLKVTALADNTTFRVSKHDWQDL